MKINGSLKLSVAESPANLEVDSAGKLIEREEVSCQLVSKYIILIIHT